MASAERLTQQALASAAGRALEDELGEEGAGRPVEDNLASFEDVEDEGTAPPVKSGFKP